LAGALLADGLKPDESESKSAHDVFDVTRAADLEKI
jgi:hypothetical protein